MLLVRLTVRRRSSTQKGALPADTQRLTDGQRTPVRFDAVRPGRLVVLRPWTRPHAGNKKLHVVDVALQSPGHKPRRVGMRVQRSLRSAGPGPGGRDGLP